MYTAEDIAEDIEMAEHNMREAPAWIAIAQAKMLYNQTFPHRPAILAAPSVPASSESPALWPVGGPKNGAGRLERTGSVQTRAHYVLTYGYSAETLKIIRGIVDIDKARDLFLEHVHERNPYVNLSLVDENGLTKQVAVYDLQVF